MDMVISAYPVRTTPNQVRWAGIIALDASERKRNEEALRRSEKLAVTGRLAASIARQSTIPSRPSPICSSLLHKLSESPGGSAAVRGDGREQRGTPHLPRLRGSATFYRQPTQPARTALEELLDSGGESLPEPRSTHSTFAWSGTTRRR